LRAAAAGSATPPPLNQTKPVAALRLGADIPVALEALPLRGAPPGAPPPPPLQLLAADCDAVMQMYVDAGQPDRDPYCEFSCVLGPTNQPTD
jgi:hypothetical protein